MDAREGEASGQKVFRVPSGLVTACLPRSKHLFVSWLQSLSPVILEPKKIKSITAANFSLSISHEAMGHFLLGRKVWQTETVLKCRDIILPVKVQIVKATFFPVVTYRCEGLYRKLSTEELILSNCCWRRLLTVPWTARSSSQSILKEISPEYSLEGLMLKLKLQYFGHLMRRTDSLEKTLMLGKVEGRRRRG